MSTPDRVASATSMDGPMSELLSVLVACDRSDLSDRVRAAGARLTRPATAVCVVGEFKQGKSSLVNGLLGVEVCPVDDDLATSAITLVRYGEQLGAVIRRKVDGKAVAEQIPVEQLSEWVSEAGNPGNHKGVERVEITAPGAILKQGLVLVDTPGMGGLGAGHAAATLSFLPFADGVILVSDASAELSAPELAFLQRASELCPTVLFAQTKIDLYPAWPTIVERNRGHLSRAGIDIGVVCVSSTLRRAALTRKDRELNGASHFPELIAALGSKVVEPAKATAADRCAADARSIASLLRAGLSEEKALLADPSKLAATMAELDAAKARLEHLRGPAAKWAQLLGDRVSELSNAVNHHFRSSMRGITKAVEDRVELLTKPQEWDELSVALQRDVADQVATAFASIETARLRVRGEVAELLRDEHVAMAPDDHRTHSLDVAALWRDKSIDESGATAKRGLQVGLTGLRGAQGGIVMFGVVGGFLPAAATAFMASNPVLLGAGAIFGGMQLAEDRKRKVTMRRQAARTQARQFLDDVQFDVANEVTTLIRELQRDLRDEFSERLAELQRTYTDVAKRAQEDTQRSQSERQARTTEVDQLLAVVAKAEAMVAS